MFIERVRIAGLNTGQRMSKVKERSGIPGSNLFRAVPLLLLAMVLSSCSLSGSDQQLVAEMTQTAESVAVASAGTPELDERVPCVDGRLLIQDLSAIDGLWGPGLEAAYDLAFAWHEDARLVGLRVTCELFEPGFRWQATYYSEEAQALYTTDTRESNPIDLEPEDIPSLDVSQLSFHAVRQALLSYDYPDDTVLEPSSGVDVRVNSVAMPFGPPETPVNGTIAHVSLDFRGETKDLFVDTATSEIFQFSSPAR